MRHLAGLLAALLLPSVALAGPWTKNFGEAYAKLGADYYVPLSYYDPALDNAGTFFGQTYSAYAEVGVLPWHPVQLGVLIPYQISRLSFEPDTGFAPGLARATTARFGDLRATLQVAILHSTVQLAAACEVKVPMYHNDTVGDGFGAWADRFPRVGDGQVDVTPMVLIGGSIPKSPVWLEGTVGYRVRTEAFIGWDIDAVLVDSVVFRATIGAHVDRAYIMVQLDGNKNVAVDEVSREGVALGPALLLDLYKGLAWELRFAGEPWARNGSQGLSFGTGLSWRIPNG